MGLHGKGAYARRSHGYGLGSFSLVFRGGETNIRYMGPAYLNDWIEIRVTVGDHNNSKGYAKFNYRFINKATGQLLAQGHAIIFFCDAKRGKRTPIVKEFIKLL